MVVVHSFPKRQKGTVTMETRAVSRLEHNSQSFRHNLDQRQAYALVSLDARGNVIVQASEQVKGYLDELKLSSQFQQAYEQSRNRSVGSPQRENLTRDYSIAHSDESTDDNAVLTVEPSIKVRGRWALQPAKKQGRSMFPRLSRPSALPTPPAKESVQEAVAQPEDVQFQTKRVTKIFRIDDTDAVTEFLVNRLKRMQQLADKKIAKAWIKGICPKKQAKFPYQNNKQEKETGVKPQVPAWWPDTETECRFIEPDHIRREERMRLCLHLLRLRPSPSQLEQWNRYDTAPSHTHKERGWTAWLQELAGPEIFEDLPREPGHRTKHRIDLMSQMYEVARMEEEYLDGALDRGTLCSFTEIVERKTCSTKRSRRPSVVSTPEYEEPASRSSSASCSRARTKRVRRDAVPATGQTMEVGTSDRKPDFEMINYQPIVPLVPDPGLSALSSFNDGFEPTRRPSLLRPKVESSSVPAYAAQSPGPSPAHPQHHAHGLPHTSSRGLPQPWHDNNMPSCNEQQSGTHVPYQAQSGPNILLGRQDFEFPQNQQVQQPYLNHIGPVAQPEFLPMPNTPVFSPDGMVPVLMDAYPLQQSSFSQIPDQHYAMSMAPTQYLMSAPADPAVADFHTPMNMAAHQYQPHFQQPHGVLAEQHMTPVQSHGLLNSQPIQWHYHHQPHQ